MKHLKSFNENVLSKEIESDIESDIGDLLIDLFDDMEVNITFKPYTKYFIIIELSGIKHGSSFFNKEIILDYVEKIKSYLDNTIKNVYKIKYCSTYRFKEDYTLLSDVLTNEILNFRNNKLYIVFKR